MFKYAVSAATSFLVGLVAYAQDPPPPHAGGPHPPPKGKSAGEELRKTYDLLRRVRSDSETGRRDERIGEWTERATQLYRRALEAREQGDPRQARELGVAAHDLARAVDHARNAARLDQPDADLPRPPKEAGPEDLDERTRRDLRHAYDRIRDGGDLGPEADSKFYLSAAKDLYNAARKDVEAGRIERGGELARAAEAMTHVPEHLRHAAEPEARGPEPKKGRPEHDDRGPEPKRDREAGGEAPLPPPLD